VDWVRGVSLQGMKLREFGLRKGKELRMIISKGKKEENIHTLMAGLHGSVGGEGMPQSTTPGIGCGRRSSRMRDSSSGGFSWASRVVEDEDEAVLACQLVGLGEFIDGCLT
jgi:hypothetical protein